jgi:hypothetical protein
LVENIKKITAMLKKSRYSGFFSKIFFTKFILHISARSVQKIRTLGLQTQFLDAHAQEIVISRHCATESISELKYTPEVGTNFESALRCYFFRHDKMDVGF